MNRAHIRQRPRNPPGGGGVGGFQPSTLFAIGEQGVWYDPSDLSTMFQDDAGTVPVTAAGQVVGLIHDKSGNGNHGVQITEASKPILRNTGALWWLEFDGVDDFLVTAAINFTATNKLSGFFGLRKMSVNPTSVVAELSVSSGANNGTFAVFAPPTTNPTLTFGTRARADATLDNTSNATFPNPTTAVLSMLIDFAGFTNMLRVNGDQTDVTAVASAVNFGNFALYVGRRAGATNPFTGLLYGLIVRGAMSSALTVAGAESYMASKSGVIL